jgi:hypothetical protein
MKLYIQESKNFNYITVEFVYLLIYKLIVFIRFKFYNIKSKNDRFGFYYWNYIRSSNAFELMTLKIMLNIEIKFIRLCIYKEKVKKNKQKKNLFVN